MRCAMSQKQNIQTPQKHLLHSKLLNITEIFLKVHILLQSSIGQHLCRKTGAYLRNCRREKTNSSATVYINCRINRAAPISAFTTAISAKRRMVKRKNEGMDNCRVQLLYNFRTLDYSRLAFITIFVIAILVSP